MLDEHLKKFAQGDASDFEAFYLATKRLMYHVALGVLGDRGLAEDAMQTAYIKILQSASSYRTGTKAQAWIARIVKNVALDEKRKRQREHFVDEQEDFALFGTAHPDEYGLLTDVARRTLSEDEFTVLMLVAVDGYKRREVASMLSIPLPTVTWKYHRALAKMRQALEDKA